MVYQVKLRIKDYDLVFEVGRMAKQANGAVYATSGGSAVLATVCSSEEKVDGLDYVPLSVDYNERYYAAGKIPGGFLKREAKPRDKEILVSRLIDRPIRPLFNKKFGREIQVVPTTLSTDQINTPDILGMNAAYAAVFISDIPFAGPVAAVRVASIDGELIINPSLAEIEKSSMDIVVAGTEYGITMVEGGAQEVSEDLMIEAIEKAHVTIKEICAIQHELRKLCGKPKVEIEEEEPASIPALAELRQWLLPKMAEAAFLKGKHNRHNAIKAVKKEGRELFKDKFTEEQMAKADELYETILTELIRGSILEKGLRCDGRGPEDIRDITCEVGVLNRTHGSALFTRGETQALAVSTLGTVYDEQIMDNIDTDERKRFMLHYNFPPFSVGEVGRLATGRREIGHGHLAERAIERVLPSRENFPYTLRIVSEVLESNGSSSMATVCGSTLCLLDAGVPITKSVAGIAMGLIKEGDKHVILSDILGEEDHLGDMDFKVAGTIDGITAFQMDIKIGGIDPATLRHALDQAKRGRLHILSIMEKTIIKPREQISPFAPKIISLKINPEKIGLVIGPGGKTIKGITEKTTAVIDIEDSGNTVIYCRDSQGAEKAKDMISALIEEPEVGKIYDGVVKRIMDFGAFIEFMPGKEGLCHISNLSYKPVRNIHDFLKIGDELKVKLVEIDRMGRMNLSHKATLPDTPENRAAAAESEQHDTYSRGEGGHGDSGRGEGGRRDGGRRDSGRGDRGDRRDRYDSDRSGGRRGSSGPRR